MLGFEAVHDEVPSGLEAFVWLRGVAVATSVIRDMCPRLGIVHIDSHSTRKRLASISRPKSACPCGTTLRFCAGFSRPAVPAFSRVEARLFGDRELLEGIQTLGRMPAFSLSKAVGD